mmetsp:Transcript_19300/g.44266  ORF Transcript_19300/g.44266 Transcript_19300/m.44266 type:complete len:332 (-) Transcript_19300:351-1346(-)
MTLSGDGSWEKLEWLKNFDVFPKTVDDAKEASVSGGTVSVVVLFFMFLLLFTETSIFLKTNTKFEMEVDTMRGGTLQINFDISFPGLPCSVLSLDSMDVSGEHELDIVHDVYKRAMDSKGNAVGAVISEKVKLARDALSISHIREQLERGEGCNIYGTLNAQKVSGNFHLSLHAQDFHVLSQVFPDRSTVNTSHVVNHLSFGRDYPGLKNPLDGEMKTLDKGSGTFEYYIKIVPTKFHHLDGTIIDTNQYSVTDHFRKLQDGFPAVYFIYDISPIMVRVKQWKQSFSHYATQLCAITGGMYVVTGQLHTWSKFLWTKYYIGKKSLTSSLGI